MSDFSALKVSNFSTGYPDTPVIQNLTLKPIQAGQVTALVGPNAAGKSTLLRALAGLLSSKGLVILDEELELQSMSLTERASRITYMPQKLPQGVGLTIMESVISALKASPVEGLLNNSDIRKRAFETLDRVGIANLALKYLDQLSGGQRQLASLAQAIVREPRVLLLDEPTSALDLRHQVVVMNLVRQLAADGKIVILVLHDLNLAAKWSDHVIVLNEGDVYASGKPSDAITPEVLAKVYGVSARIERCTYGCVQVMVDGPLGQADIGMNDLKTVTDNGVHSRPGAYL